MALPVNKRLQLLIYCFLMVLSSASAQQVSPMFFKEIQLSHKPYTLHTLTREIQRQSGITFSYDAVKIDPNKRVKLKRSIDRLTVKELLAVLRKKTGIGYKIVSSSHIIYTPPGGKIRKSTAAFKPKALRKKASYVAPAEEVEEEEVYIPALREDSTFQHQIVVVGDSSLAVAYYLSGGGSGGGAYNGNGTQRYPVTADQLEDNDENTPSSRAARDRDYNIPLGQTATVAFIKQSGFMAAGLTADETYYLNPTLTAGFSFLYGIVSYSLGNFPHWRYGLGVSAKINSRWSGHFEYSTGNIVQQRYSIQSFDTFQPPPDDSIILPPIITVKNTPLQVQSRLNRFTLAAEWNIAKNIYLGGGLTLNILKTTYYSNGNQVTLSDILPVGYDADQKYRTINPPYVLSNSYSGNSSSNTKIWIGVQLRLTYRLNFFKP